MPLIWVKKRVARKNRISYLRFQHTLGNIKDVECCPGGHCEPEARAILMQGMSKNAYSESLEK